MAMVNVAGHVLHSLHDLALNVHGIVQLAVHLL